MWLSRISILLKFNFQHFIEYARILFLKQYELSTLGDHHICKYKEEATAHWLMFGFVDFFSWSYCLDFELGEILSICGWFRTPVSPRCTQLVQFLVMTTLGFALWKCEYNTETEWFEIFFNISRGLNFKANCKYSVSTNFGLRYDLKAVIIIQRLPISHI